MGHEGLLEGMETSFAPQPLDGQDLLALNILYGRLAGSNGHIIDKHRAGPAKAFAASVFRPGQSKIGPQNPQEHPIGIHGYLHGSMIEFECNILFHEKRLHLY